MTIKLHLELTIHLFKTKLIHFNLINYVFLNEFFQYHYIEQHNYFFTSLIMSDLR
jgi:hypothetical protein